MRYKILGYIFIIVVGLAIIAGLYYWQTVRQIPANIPMPVHQDATANWKIYTNTQYGFEMKIPQNLTATNGSSDPKNTDLVFFNSPETTALIGTIPGPVYDIAFFPAKTAVPKGLEGEMYNDLGKKVINGMDFTYYVGIAQCNVYSYEIPHNSLFYTFSTCDANKKATLEQMLSTLKFTNVADASNWKTYTNTQYGFEFKYPATFHINEGVDFQCPNKNCWNIVITDGTKSYGIMINSSSIKRKSVPTEHVSNNGIQISKSQYDKGMLYDFTDGINQFIVLTVPDSEDFYNQILSTFKFTN